MASTSQHTNDSSQTPTQEQPSKDYTHWSNTDLIKRVAHLEHQLRALNTAHTASTSPTPSKKQPKKPLKPFDPTKYSTRQIALRFAYLGARYNGFEHHANNKTPLPTVEEVLWRALRKTKLIFPTFREGQSENEVEWEGCGYSKCGRTDRGVSAFGQVVGLVVRSSRPKREDQDMNADTAAENENVANADNDHALESTGSPPENLNSESTSQWHPIKDELPYIQLLNRVLPPSIRILAWCPNPPPNFSARFNCRERRYRYFFTNPAYIPTPSTCAATPGIGDGWLNIKAMQNAAKRFEGLHDFRNFCKVDPSKQITNFSRRIFHASIQPSHTNSTSTPTQLDAARFLTFPPFNSSKPLEMFYFEVHGSAFLWHQVRHMVAVLFLVGQGYEEPEIVDKLLDVQNCPAKPVYEMADERPLVLWDCIFPDPDATNQSDREGVEGANGHEDALEWIYAGDTVSDTNGKKEKSRVTEAMQDRKYGRLGLMEDLWTQWRKTKIDETLAASLMDVVAKQGDSSSESTLEGSQSPEPEVVRVGGEIESARVFDGSDAPRNVGKYVPLMQRARMETPEVLNKRYAVRKGLGDKLSSGDVDVDE